MRVLVISDVSPYPPISGAPQRTHNLLRRMAANHEICLATFTASQDEVDGIVRVRDYCSRVETVPFRARGALAQPLGFVRYLLSGTPPDLRFYYSSELAEAIARLTADVAFDIVQIENSYMAPYLGSVDLRGGRTTATVLDCHDVVYEKYAHISKIEPRRARRLRAGFHSRMMRHWEPRYAARFDCCLMMSEHDRREITGANPRVCAEVVPNGVDTQLLRPLPRADARPAVILVGDMRYRPNVDGALMFRERVLPKVRSALGDVDMWIVGRDPPPELAAIAGDGVYVTGWVDRVEPYYARSPVVVVPLRAGSGTRLKILEAMALGRPVVSTSIGCEGIDAKDSDSIFVADDVQEFARKTTLLLTDEALRRRMALRARELVESRYDWDVVVGILAETYERLRNRGSMRDGLLSSAVR